MSKSPEVKLVNVPSPNFVPEKDLGKPLVLEAAHLGSDFRSEERRVGKEC